MEAWRIAGGVSIAVALWLVTFGVAMRSPGSRALAVSLSHGVTGAFLLASAALALAIWRITGTTRAACAVVGLALAGLSSPVMGILSRAANSGDVRPDLFGVLAAITELVLIACVAAALLLPQVTAWLRPIRIAAPIVVICILAVAGVLAADAEGDTSAFLGDIAAAMRMVNVVLWLLVATLYIVVGRNGQRPGTVALGIAALVPAAGAATRLLIGPVEFENRLVPNALALSAACVIAGVATVSLWRLHTWHGSKLIEVAGKLRSTRTDLADLESDQARRLHDARNAIFAIAGATEILAHPTEHDELTPDRLQRLISAELDRLSHLLDPGFRGSNRTFTAADLISPLVAAYRARGLEIDADIAAVQLHSRRDLLVGVITNILTNARTHAPHARIWISASPIAYDAALGQSAARIVIADDGPGIPPDQREAVLLPGVRGSAAAATPGHGLGLASAVQALSEVGGTLRLSEREGGGTVVTVTIPTTAPQRADVRCTDHAHTIAAGAPSTAHTIAAGAPSTAHTIAAGAPSTAHAVEVGVAARSIEAGLAAAGHSAARTGTTRTRRAAPARVPAALAHQTALPHQTAQPHQTAHEHQTAQAQQTAPR